jgi:hypothetical protein
MLLELVISWYPIKTHLNLLRVVLTPLRFKRYSLQSLLARQSNIGARSNLSVAGAGKDRAVACCYLLIDRVFGVE